NPYSGRAPGTLRSTKVVTRVSERDIVVLGVVVGHFERVMEKSGCCYEQLQSDVLSARYVAERAGLKHPPQAMRAIDKLVAAGLVWRNPNGKALKPGQRAACKYRPTHVGMSFMRQLSEDGA